MFAMGMTVEDIRGLLDRADAAEFAVLERSLRADTRKGVVRALEKAKRRLDAEADEERRIEGLYEFDRERARGASGMVVGLDEVGRGAIAGPLAVGAVVLPDEPRISALDDSKRLTPEQRERVADEIKRSAIAFAVAYVEPAEIDREGMSASLRKAFSEGVRLIEERGVEIGTVLIDGNPLGIDGREQAVVKGDSKSAAIAAASIVAKVERDEFMRQLDSTFPQYGFPHHKGYGVAEHADAIRAWGLSPVHRASFCKSFLQEPLF